MQVLKGLAMFGLALALSSTAIAQPNAVEHEARQAARQDREAARQAAQRDKEAGLYEQGQAALDDSRWSRALDAFTRVVAMKGAKADAALYWKAYAENKLGQRAEALATVAELLRAYPNTRYQGEAKALEAQVRRDAGQPARPEGESDEDLKLMALQGLQQSDPERAIPLLDKVLQGSSSPRLKARALFVLAQSNSPKARALLTSIAKGASTPDLQSKAIQYLAIHGGSESRAALADIYRTSADVDVKRRILRAFMVSGERQRLLTAATSEQNPELRAEAVRQLGVMGAHDELWQLYQKETSLEVKKDILQAMFIGGNATRLVELAKTERTPELRRTAVRNLGLLGAERTGSALAEIYALDKDPAIRKAVIEALFVQGNAEGLVALARKESSPEMRREIVQKLSIMRSKAALDYMEEILK